MSTVPVCSSVSSAQNLVILVVDDDYAARLQMRFSLENEGLKVVEAESGLEALDYFRNNPVDLVLLDVIMPGIDGFMTCREIRSLPDGVHLPVIMITGLEDEGTINEAFNSGATDFVCKPINLLILGYRVRYWLRSAAVLQALQINQTRLFKAQEIARLGHWERNLTNGDFQLTCHNAEIFGLSVPYTYDSLFAPILPEEAAEARKRLDDACRDGARFSIQYRITLPGHGVRIILNQGEVVRKGASQTLHAVGIIQDITERQKADESLRDNERKWRAVFEHSPVGIVLLSSQSNIVDCNRRCAEIFGVARQHYLGINLLEKLPPGPLRQALQLALTGEGIHHFEGFYTSVFSGKEVYVNIVSERVSPELFVVVLADFSEQRQAMDAQEKLQVQLTQAQKMEAVGRLAGGVAHDFNNMLGVILGRTDIALDALAPDHPLVEDLQEIRIAANRSADLTRQLLAFASKQTASPKVLNLNDVVAGMLKMLQRLIGENINLLWQPGKDLRSIKIDPSQLDQILVNLCVNARDAIAGVGTITVSTELARWEETSCTGRKESAAGEYVLLTVTDDGCGMDEEILSSMFEPFFTTKAVGRGTGLGLATTYGIVKQNQGFINVASKPGKGSTFKIFLPPHRSNAEVTVENGHMVAAIEGCKTILLVEDEGTILSMITRMLEGLGYNVLAAPGPLEAISLAQKCNGKIDLLLTDVVMPEMNGRDLAGKILVLQPDVEILFMSGYTADIIANQGVVHEGVAFIQKPFSKRDLADKLCEILKKRECRDSAKSVCAEMIFGRERPE
ncbi:MAG: response regulator [Pseudomonadota bacterium]